jgi:DNA polymerase-3 subunit delta'
MVAAARRWLAEASGAPVSATRRVVLVDQLDRAGEDVQNVLLKALEEPAPRHLYLLLSDDPHRLLPTIRSRVQAVRLGPLPSAELVALLMDLDRLPEEQAVALARLSGGLAGRARRFAQRPEWLDWRRTTQAELLALLSRGWADRMAAARELIDQAGRLVPRAPADNAADEPEAVRVPASSQRAAALAVTDAWIDLGRDLLVSAAGHPDQAASRELFTDLERTGRRIGAPALAAVLGELDRVRDGIESNANPRLALEAAMLSWPRMTAAPA